MNQEQKARTRQAPGQGLAQAKKPYEKPSFRCEKIFETMALNCGKVIETQPSCKGSNKKVS